MSLCRLMTDVHIMSYVDILNRLWWDEIDCVSSGCPGVCLLCCVGCVGCRTVHERAIVGFCLLK